MGRDILVAWWDPDYEYKSLEEYEIQVQEKARTLESIKKGIIEHREVNHILTEKVKERMRILMLQVQSPEPSSTLQ